MLLLQLSRQQQTDKQLLSHIHHRRGWCCAGEPMEIKKAVCLHEEDAGLLWKHMDYRNGGRLAASMSACC